MNRLLRTHPSLYPLLLLSLVFLVSPATAAFTGYMKLGDIKGESKAVDHEEEIDIHGMSWGVGRPLDAEDTGSARTRSNPVFEDLVVRKRIDKSTPKLMEACANGKVFPDLVLTVRKDSGDAHLDYLVITLKNVSVTSVNIGGDDSEEVPVSFVGFNYEELEVLYTEFDESGASQGNVEMTWDVEAGNP